jgi:hypothetical protein
VLHTEDDELEFEGKGYCTELGGRIEKAEDELLLNPQPY